MSELNRKFRESPNRLDVAGRFATDAADFIARFRCTYYSDDFDFQSIKSRRFKAFGDLRISIEATLKGFIALRQPYGSGGRDLVHVVEKFGHKLERLTAEMTRLWRCQIAEDLRQLISQCEKLPVGLRYSLDAFDYLEAHEELYYETIGSDHWMKRVEKLAEEARKCLQDKLSRRAKVIAVSAENIEELLQDGFNKYRDKQVARKNKGPFEST